MNPVAFTPNRPPDFVVPARLQAMQAPCHSYTNRRYLVPLNVWHGTAFGPAQRFLLDTGADFCTVDYTFATAYGFQLDANCMIPFGALGSDGWAWLTKRYLRFSQFPTMRFSFHFLVPIPFTHPDHPNHDPGAQPLPTHPLLLGTADLMDVVELVLTTAGAGFFVLSGRGSPVGP